MNNEHIDKRIEDALNSTHGMSRAAPKPYLFTRLKARMERRQETAWDKATRLIARPAFAMAGLCLVICINALVIAYNNPSGTTGTITNELATADEFSASVATLYYAENTEP